MVQVTPMAAFPPRPPVSRQNRKIESRLRSEYLNAHFKPSQIFWNQRLGAPTIIPADMPADLPVSALANRLGYADAMVLPGTELQLWEAKISAADGGAVGQLLVYGHKAKCSAVAATRSAAGAAAPGDATPDDKGKIANFPRRDCTSPIEAIADLQAPFGNNDNRSAYIRPV